MSIQVKVYFLGRALTMANEPQRYARPEFAKADFPPFDLIGGFLTPGTVFDFPFSDQEVRNSPMVSGARQCCKDSQSNELR